MSEEEAFREAKEELRIRGLEYRDILRESSEDRSKRAFMFEELMRAAEETDATKIELCVSKLCAVSSDFNFFTGEKSFIQTTSSLTTAALLVLDKEETCHFVFKILLETLQRSNVMVDIWDDVSKRLLSNMGADVLENGVMCDDFLRVLMAGSKCCYRTKQELLEYNTLTMLMHVLATDWRTSHITICKLTRTLLARGQGDAPVPLARIHELCDAELANMLVKILKDDCEKPLEYRSESILYLIESLLISEIICTIFMEADAFDCFLRILAQPFSEAQTKFTLGCLRRILILESTRIRFVESGGVQLVNRILLITGKHHGIVERALGVLVAASLRNVHLTEVMVHEQHFDTLMDLMRKHKDEGGIQRQCCMLIRNCTASGAQIVKSMLIEQGVEDLLRLAKKEHLLLCSDVGSAALRDLGCTNYNEDWNPRTLVLGIGGGVIDTTEL